MGKIVSKQGFPGASVIKNPPAKAGDMGLIPGLGRCPGERNGNPLQYSCLENPTDRGFWRVTVHGVTKESDMTEHTHGFLRQEVHAHPGPPPPLSSLSLFLVDRNSKISTAGQLREETGPCPDKR